MRALEMENSLQENGVFSLLSVVHMSS